MFRLLPGHCQDSFNCAIRKNQCISNNVTEKGGNLRLIILNMLWSKVAKTLYRL